MIGLICKLRHCQLPKSVSVRQNKNIPVFTVTRSTLVYVADSKYVFRHINDT